MTDWRVTTEAQLADALDRASREAIRLLPRGHGTRGLLPDSAALPSGVAFLDVGELCGIEAIDAEEMVLTARAGTPLSEIDAAASDHDLFLPPLWAEPVQGSIGGWYSDPREGATAPRLGLVRDHVLGVEAVRGDGVAFAAGGRVVKNVTGYDLTRFLCGARGRWGVVTRVHWRLLPRPRLTTRARWEVHGHEALWAGLDALRDEPCDPLRLTVSQNAMSRSAMSQSAMSQSAMSQGAMDPGAPNAEASLPEAGDPELRLEVELLESGTERACAARNQRYARALLPHGWNQLDPASPTIPGIMNPVSSDSATSDGPWHLRLCLPYSRWRELVLPSPQRLSELKLHPFAHFAMGQVIGPLPQRLATLRDLDATLSALGGSVQLERVPARGGPDLEPWSLDLASPPALARIEEALRLAWDPAGVLCRAGCGRWEPGTAP